MPKLRSNDAPEPQACEPAEFLALTLRKKRAVAGYGTLLKEDGGPLLRGESQGSPVPWGNHAAWEGRPRHRLLIRASQARFNPLRTGFSQPSVEAWPSRRPCLEPLV